MIGLTQWQAARITHLAATHHEEVFVEATNVRGVVAASIGRRAWLIGTDGRTQDVSDINERGEHDSQDVRRVQMGGRA